LLAQARVSKSTFSFADVLDDIKRVFSRKPKYAEEPYMAVSYWEKGASFVEERHRAMDPGLLTKLFILARSNRVPPANKIKKACELPL
jgi:hypothetical protein